MGLLKNSIFQRVLLVAIILALIFFWRNSVRDAEIRKNIAKQNELAMKGEIERIKTDYNTTLTKTYTLVYAYDSLEVYAADLKKSIERVKETLNGSEIWASTQADIEINGLSGNSTNTEMEYSNGRGVFKWRFDRDTVGIKRILAGKTEYSVSIIDENVNIIPGNTTILEDNFEIQLFLHSVINEDKTISVVAETLNDNVRINQLKSTFEPLIIEKQIDRYLDVHRSSIDWGVHAGVGVNPFSITSESGAFQPIMYIGLGIGFNFSNIIDF